MQKNDGDEWKKENNEYESVYDKNMAKFKEQYEESFRKLPPYGPDPKMEDVY